MGVYTKFLLVAGIVVALAISALAVSTEAALFETPWASVLIAAAGLFNGAVMTLAMYSLAAARRQSAPAPAVSGNFFNDNAFLAFVEQLLAATTSEGLRRTIQANLPPLIGGRSVWIVSDLPKRGPVEEAESREIPLAPPLTGDVQEWTTFPLRLNDESVGLLGVESAGGLGADRRHAIQRATVLLARAVRTVGTIETFREAGLVDLLTGAATRREGLNRLQSEVKRAQRIGTAMAIMMIDLDHFKSVNDRFGHAVGDALLTAIGRTLRSTLRASDIRCRWGGEEFLIILPDSDLARAQVVATHLLQNIAATFVPTPSGPVTTTASIGLTITRPGETAISNLVARADLALYRAKREGRSCVRVVLGDHEGKPIAADGGSPQGTPPRHPTLPFPDRRSAQRADRRRVPSSGRRRSDPAPPAAGSVPATADSAGSAESNLGGSNPFLLSAR